MYFFNSHKASILIVVFVAAFIMVGLAQAETINVGPGRGYAIHTIQDGIDDANDGDVVLVAPYEYVITEPITFRGKAIIVRSESGPEQTTIRNASDYDFNMIVLFDNGEDSGSLLEGFTIKDSPDRGVSCVDSSPRIENCVFIANFASGIQCLSSSPIVNNCVITGSQGDSGINCREKSSPLITNCTLQGNMALDSGGGGIYCNDSSPTIINCIIIDNKGEYIGGGVECINKSSPTIINCTINNNSAPLGGGIYNEEISHPALTNCTISNNSADYAGGGIYNMGGSLTVLTNCILWSNFAPKGAEISDDLKSVTMAIYSDIQGGWPGEGNIDEDPLFAEPDHWADINDPNVIVEPNDPNAIWIDGDYHLKSSAGRWDPNSESWVVDDVNSPCIDAGDPNSPVAFEPYPNGMFINMGAYGGTTEASKSPSGLHAKYGHGTGEPNNPYQIYTAEHLNTLADNTGDYNKHFKLMADVNMAEYLYNSAVIAPSGINSSGLFTGVPFNGAFDGNGHVISNLAIEGHHYLGLFGYLDGFAIVSNLGIEGIDVNGVADCVAGIAGFSYGSIIGCYSTGVVDGNEYVGGLAGYNSIASNITNCYSMAVVNGNDKVGGLAGYTKGNVTTCYSTGIVTGTGQNVGGLIGERHLNYGIVTESFWDIQTSGQAISAGGTGKTTAEMQTESTFTDTGWDFVGETDNGTEDIWWIDEGIDYPRLCREHYSVRLPVIEIDPTDFDAVIAEGVVLVDFYATWCSHCATQAPILEEVADQLGGQAQVAKLDVDQASSIVQKYGISAIPTLIVFQKGIETTRFVGVTEADELIAAIMAALASIE